MSNINTANKSASVRALKVGTVAVALLETDTDSAFRLCKVTASDKDGVTVQCVQSNSGTSYDGKSAVIRADGTFAADKEGRLHFGAYIKSKSGALKARLMTLAQARALCNYTVHGVLRGVKTKVLCYARSQASDYVACLDTTGRKSGEHVFHVETRSLGERNRAHYIKVEKWEARKK